MELAQRLELLEGELKIVKNEVKEVLAEIRAAILDRQNPFALEGPPGFSAPPVQVVRADAEDEEDAPEPENILAPERRAAADSPAPASRAEYAAPQAGAAYPSAGGHQPPEERGMTPAAADANMDGAAHHQLRVVPAGQERGKTEGSPSWSLLTISSLMLWADDAARRIGPRRLEMMLELCEISGYIDAKLKGALLRAVDGQAPEPEKAPPANECLLTLRELEALLHDEQPDLLAGQLQRAARRRR